jgi:hypothetical protein
MGGGVSRVSDNEYICVHHVTWSPNKLWRSNSYGWTAGYWVGFFILIFSTVFRIRFGLSSTDSEHAFYHYAKTGPDPNPGSGSSLCHHIGHKNLHFFIPVSRIQSVPQGRHLFRVLAKINVKCFFASVLALFANTYLPNQCESTVSGLSYLLCAFSDNYSS